MNYFETKSAAERYAKGRPFTHPKAIEKFRNFMNLQKNFKRCLDVACGTGQSTTAVAEICDEVIGIDISEDMMIHAPRHPKIKYQTGKAENLPFDDNSFDLVSAGLALHWFDQPVFLKEAHRVLNSDGWLIFYFNLFERGVTDLPEFKHWYDAEYLKRYPQPPRKNQIGFDNNLAAGIFEVNGPEEYGCELQLTQEQLIAYIVSQSNVIAAVEQKGEAIEDVIKWLSQSTNPFFANNQTRNFLFDGKIWYLKKLD
jgi:ubiquinone/menaquinone biosynthesis C-methylase UbiE